MYNNVFCFYINLLFTKNCFFLCLSLFVSYFFLVATFDGLRPLLVTSHCSLRSLANKLRSFVRSDIVFFRITDESSDLGKPHIE